MRECFFGSHSVPPTHENVLGVLSLIFYSLLLVISIKYLAIVMRADNQGEGGILALTALLPAAADARAAATRPVLIAARHLRRGAALRRRHDHAGHLGARRRRGPEGRDAAVRAVRRAAHGRDPDRASSRSSATAPHRVGRLFGPIMVVWFVVHRGARRRVDRASSRSVLAAFDPRHARALLREQRLARLRGARRGVPGGHRRRGALRRHGPLRQAADPPRVVRAGAAGAAAQLLRPGRAAAARTRRPPSSPFFLLAPAWALLPLVGARHARPRSSRRRRSSPARSR